MYFFFNLLLEIIFEAYITPMGYKTRKCANKIESVSIWLFFTWQLPSFPPVKLGDSRYVLAPKPDQAISLLFIQKSWHKFRILLKVCLYFIFDNWYRYIFHNKWTANVCVVIWGSRSRVAFVEFVIPWRKWFFKWPRKACREVSVGSSVYFISRKQLIYFTASRYMTKNKDFSLKAEAPATLSK